MTPIFSIVLFMAVMISGSLIAILIANYNRLDKLDKEKPTGIKKSTEQVDFKRPLGKMKESISNFT